jgi:hypothetical protein
MSRKTRIGAMFSPYGGILPRLMPWIAKDSDMKQELCELLLAKFDAGYQVYKNYLTDTSAIDRILKRAQKKREPLPGPRSPRFVVKLELSKS